MAITTSQKTVATTATLLATADADGGTVAVQTTGSTDVYVGGSDVTTANGYKVAQNGQVSFDLDPNDALYGRVASGTSTVCCIANRGTTLA